MREDSSIVKKIRLDRKRRDVKLPLYFHTDACQAANYLDMQVSRLGVDLLTLNAGKIYGPKQCGALYVKKGVSLKPLILGGGQEWNLRSGTENLANIVGFAAAWQKIRVDYRDEAYRLSKLRDSFFKFINDQIPSAVINGPKGSGRLPNNIHLTFPGQDNERLLMWLDERGFQVATGSACSASSDEPSHVLKAMGLSDEAARSSLRITLGRYTTEKSLQDLGKALLKAVAKN
jgi:cysteine desulfurase